MSNNPIKEEWFKKRDCGLGVCTVCGQTYQKQTHNSLACGDECRRARDTRRKQRSMKGPCTCVVCGKKFVGKLPHYPYKCCGSVECRNEMRRRGKTVAVRQKLVTVCCLKCGKLWKSPSRFIRTCPECKRNRGLHETYSTVWGAAF